MKINILQKNNIYKKIDEVIMTQNGQFGSNILKLYHFDSLRNEKVKKLRVWYFYVWFTFSAIFNEILTEY